MDKSFASHLWTASFPEIENTSQEEYITMSTSKLPIDNKMKNMFDKYGSIGEFESILCYDDACLPPCIVKNKVDKILTNCELQM